MPCLGGFVFLLVFLSFTDGQTDVRMPPFIIKGPKEFQIYRSEDRVTLDCKGGGVPDVTYEWKKTGFTLNLNLPNLKLGTDGTITIEHATVMDEGYYQCFVTNQYGTALSVTSRIQRAFLDSISGTLSVVEKTVTEGEPFHIQAVARKSFPKAAYGWEVANDTVDRNPSGFYPSSRVQIADNGDLYFAYAKPEDYLSGKLYKSTIYNQYLDIKTAGGYTKIIVVRVPGGQTSFAPTLGFSSEPQTVAKIGEQVSLRCFFYGNPEPTISWRGPRSTLPMNRYKLGKSNTEITIVNIQASDQGDYICTASNSRGSTQHRLQLRVEAKPTFKNFNDGPRNTNVTEGDDAVFKCNAEAIPSADIVWLQDGKVLDLNAPPRRFAFSNDRKTLTIRNVCRNCDNSDRPSDLTVIQCNASNIHGYAFSSGYLNVLAKTQIIPDDEIEVSVDMNEEKRIDFDCSAVSDPSTPPTVRWYRMIDGKEELVYDEPPTVTLKSKDGEPSLMLSIFVSPNGANMWTKYHGEYHCVAFNGYSRAMKQAFLQVNNYDPPPPDYPHVFIVWPIILVAVILILIASVLAIYCCLCHNKSPNSNNVGGYNGRQVVTIENSTVPHHQTIPYDNLSAAYQVPPPTNPHFQQRNTPDTIQNNDPIHPSYLTPMSSGYDPPSYGDCIRIVDYENQ